MSCTVFISNKMNKIALAFVGLVALFVGVKGHGMVMDPPNRSSMWRFDPSAPINWDDDQNYCGGMTVRKKTLSPFF